MTSAGPLTLWRGWDPRKGTAASTDQAALLLDDPGHPSEEMRYELLAVAARGFRPPQVLTVLTLTAPAAGEHEASSASTPGGALRLAWSMEYRQVAETAPKKVTPYAIYLLGVNPPEGVSDEELEEFNDFYTNVHLPEVAERRHALRAVRYELVRAAKPPYQGAPRFLAAYEVDEEGASNRRHSGPPYSSGPEVWQGHKTPWRLWYRLLGN